MQIQLTRNILHSIQCGNSLEIAGYETDNVFRHVGMLREQGFLDDGNRLTCKGNDLAGLILNDHVWYELPRNFTAAELDALPLPEVKYALKLATRKWLETRLT